jgi:hypothetical protein
MATINRKELYKKVWETPYLMGFLSTLRNPAPFGDR